MTILLQDMHDGVVEPFSPDQSITNYITIVFTALSVTADFLALYALLKQRNLAFDSYYIVSMTIADLGFSLLCLVIETINAMYGGWAHGCFWDGVIIIVFMGASIVSMFSMTLHKFLSIIFQIQLAQGQVVAVIVASWVVPSVTLSSFIAALSPETFWSLQTSYGWCFLALDGNDPWNTVGGFMVGLFIGGTVVFLVYAHIVIVLAYQKLKNPVETSEASAVGMSASGDLKVPTVVKLNPEQLRLERLLINKSIAISAFFSFNWVCFLIKIIYEVSAKEQVPLIFEMFVEIIGVSTPIVNVFILYYYDFKFKRNVREVLRLDYFQKVVTTSGILSVVSRNRSVNGIKSTYSNTMPMQMTSPAKSPTLPLKIIPLGTSMNNANQMQTVKIDLD